MSCLKRLLKKGLRKRGKNVQFVKEVFFLVSLLLSILNLQKILALTLEVMEIYHLFQQPVRTALRPCFFLVL